MTAYATYPAPLALRYPEPPAVLPDGPTRFTRMDFYAWPVMGEEVRLIKWAEGNTLTGNHSGIFQSAIGKVIETPHRSFGSVYLVIQVESSYPRLSGHIYDRAMPERWSMTKDRVTFSRGCRTEWTIDRVTRG
jgi:hypothetical protein